MLCRNSKLQRRQPRISWQTVWKYFAVTTSFRMLGQTKLDWWTVAISPSVAESDVDFVNPTKNNWTRISISLEPSRASRQSFRIKTRSERFILVPVGRQCRPTMTKPLVSIGYNAKYVSQSGPPNTWKKHSVSCHFGQNIVTEFALFQILKWVKQRVQLFIPRKCSAQGLWPHMGGTCS